MNNSSSAFHYQEIIQKLHTYCTNQYSGTMFITTHDNHSIRFILKKGTIVFLAYRFQSGNDALPIIQKMKSGVFSFKKDVFVGKDDPTLLDTNTLLQILTNTQTSSNTEQTAPKEQAKQTNKQHNITSEYAVSHHATSFISDDDVNQITAKLSLFIGPIAQVIVEEYIDDYGKPSSPLELERMLAEFTEEIDDMDKKEQFKQQLARFNYA